MLLNEQMLIDAIDREVHSLDEPLADWATFPLDFLAREARASGVPVVMAGEGSDELFAGYAGDQRGRQLIALSGGPRAATGVARRVAQLGSRCLLALSERLGRGRGLQDDLERIGGGDPPFIGLQIGLTEALKRKILDPDRDRFRRPGNALGEQIDRVSRAAGAGSRLEGLDWIRFLEIERRLPDLLLSRLDRMTMSHGIEARVPFLDHELVALGLALPASLLTRAGVSKYPLKRAAERWLPADVLDQPKRAFGAPVAQWLRGRLGQVVEQRICESALTDERFIRADAARMLISQHRSGRMDNAQAIWSLFCACRWYDLVARNGQ